MSDGPVKINFVTWLKNQYAAMKAEDNTGPDVMVEVYVREIIDRIENGEFQNEYAAGAAHIIQHLRDQGFEITYHQQKAIDEFIDYAQSNGPDQKNS